MENQMFKSLCQVKSWHKIKIKNGQIVCGTIDVNAENSEPGYTHRCEKLYNNLSNETLRDTPIHNYMYRVQTL